MSGGYLKGGVLGRADLGRERMCSRPLCLRTFGACPGLGVASLRSVASGGGIFSKKKQVARMKKAPPCGGAFLIWIVNKGQPFFKTSRPSSSAI